MCQRSPFFCEPSIWEKFSSKTNEADKNNNNKREKQLQVWVYYFGPV